jgi:hypothetical protein
MLPDRTFSRNACGFFKPHEVPIGLSAEELRGHHVERQIKSPFGVQAVTGKAREHIVALVGHHGREHRHVGDVFVRDNRGLLDSEVCGGDVMCHLVCDETPVHCSVNG